MSASNFGGSGCNLTKLYQGTWLEARVIKYILILQEALQNLGGQKCPKFSAIFDNFRVWSRIPQERIDLSKIRIAVDQLRFIPYWAKKFGELWSTNQKVTDAYVDPPNWIFFRETIFWPLGYAGPSNFYTPYNPLMPGNFTIDRTRTGAFHKVCIFWALSWFSTFIPLSSPKEVQLVFFVFIFFSRDLFRPLGGAGPLMAEISLSKKKSTITFLLVSQSSQIFFPAIYGRAAPQIFTQSDQDLLAHTPNCDGVPPK